jgi:hypothetical protein
MPLADSKASKGSSNYIKNRFVYIYNEYVYIKLLNMAVVASDRTHLLDEKKMLLCCHGDGIEDGPREGIRFLVTQPHNPTKASCFSPLPYHFLVHHPA